MKQIDKTAIIYEPVTIVEWSGSGEHSIVIGKNCVIGQFTFIAAKEFHMFEGADIRPQATIGGGGDVWLDKFSLVGFGARLFPASDTTRGKYMCDTKPESERVVVRGSIHVGEGAYIGANAIVCVTKKHPHIHIGEFAVVGAGSYIDSDVEAYTIIHPRTLATVVMEKTKRYMPKPIEVPSSNNDE
jgi:acetyltransferase-like isoleucine patch superfamily enzyme